MNLNTNTWRMVSPEQLTHLGKTAAQTAETSGMSLTDAVVRSIGMSKLNSEQVRRVVEAANHEAFNRKFAAMDSSMRVVELEGGPADPKAVLERLHLAAQPTPVSGFSDYSLEPAPKLASLGIAAPYTTTKTAALTDVRVLNERLKAAHDELVGQVAVAGGHVHDSTQKLAALVKEACTEGAFYEDFERAWGSISPRHATELLSQMHLPRAPSVKTASRQISEGHPLLSEFSVFVKHAKDYEVACEAVRSVEAELVRIDSFFGSVG